jgi:hypothetical protein
MANGCFQKFSCEQRIGEATQRALGKYTEPGKTKVWSGRAHQNCGSCMTCYFTRKLMKKCKGHLHALSAVSSRFSPF